MEKRVYILVGPKGVGKSHLGQHLQQRLGLRFLRVEDIWIKLKEEGLQTMEYESEGSRRVIEAISKLLNNVDQIVIESIGASQVFDFQVKELKKISNVMLIRIRAPLALCLQRVKGRNPALHLNLSDKRVAEINEIAANFETTWDLEFDNSTENSEHMFIDKFRKKFLAI